MAAPATVASRPRGAHGRAYPVVEIFGPTVQGEGPDAGRPAYFVRFGGCDFRCTWCDSMHAVDPAAVRAAEHLTAEGIVARLGELDGGPRLVVLSGGNPVLHELGPLIEELRRAGLEVAVETQGSVWRDWVGEADTVVVSPKPPSSGMVSADHDAKTARFLERLAGSAAAGALKVVVFDEEDLRWAAELHAAWPRQPFFISAGTDVGLSEDATVAALRERYRWLCEAVARRPRLKDVRVLPQLHVIAWGTALGV